jgi:integrase
MATPSTRIPKYRKHKQSGQAIVTLPDGIGGRRDVLLGQYRTAASKREYKRVIAEWLASGRRWTPPSASGRDLSINELILAFWPHAEQHYQRDGRQRNGELSDYKLSLRPLREMYGQSLACEFGPLALKAVRQKMIEADLCRGVINQRIGRIRRIFKWAVANELLGPDVLQRLQAVEGLRAGRSPARETEPVKPVSEALVDATLPHVLPEVAAMVRIQLLTGARPGEVCIMRATDIDMSGKVWLYRPRSHKTAYRGHARVIPIGPRAQDIIRHWLKTDLSAYLFSPREAMEGLRLRQRKKRKTPVQPSQRNRRKRKPRRVPGEHYSTGAYAYAVRRACVKAGVPHWHPHQLRHTKATEIRREAGLDAARAVLGHRSPQVTEVYAELDHAKAAEIMARIG